MININGSVEPAAPGGQCHGCRSDETAPIEMVFAFQPIVDLTSGDAYAYEVLVRGPNDDAAESVLSQVGDANRYRFEQRCRATFENAEKSGIPISRIFFETAGARDFLASQGITLMQGYLFAKPVFKAMPSISNAS